MEEGGTGREAEKGGVAWALLGNGVVWEVASGEGLQPEQDCPLSGLPPQEHHTRPVLHPEVLVENCISSPRGNVPEQSWPW